MTLTNRLSLYFLTALAVVLAGSSATLYLLARTHLYHQQEERLAAALNTLAAAAEIDADGIEWETHDRNLDFGLTGPVCWIVGDGQGRLLDRSPATMDEPPFDALLAYSTQQPGEDRIAWQGQWWQIGQRRIEAPSPGSTPSGPAGIQKFPVLVLAAAISEEPVQQALRSLAQTSAGVSLAFWLLAFFAGRWVCRKALSPVSRMAAAARQMDADSLGQRLPTPGSKDELEDLSRAFNDLLERLEVSFERQRRFTGAASHQLRTPLAAMLGQVQVALRRERSPEEYQRVLSVVQERALHLRKLVEMLLFLSRADSEAGLPDLEAINLTTWLPAHLHSWSEHPRAGDIRLELSSDAPLGVKAHPPLLGQLVDNLLDNACKYSKPGTAITLRLGVEPGLVLLAVQDQGQGIAAEDLPHVFEPFYRSSEARRSGTEGVGLGLAVARRIALAVGGEITLQSHLGHGACFTLRMARAGTGSDS
jgi:heavy metal sensor kinase